MIAEAILGVVIGGHVLKELARDNTIREKLQQWSEEAARKAEEYSNK